MPSSFFSTVLIMKQLDTWINSFNGVYPFLGVLMEKSPGIFTLRKIRLLIMSLLELLTAR